jgi:hypothetical protein
LWTVFEGSGDSDKNESKTAFPCDEQKTKVGGDNQMKKRILIAILCIAVVGILSACNKPTDDPGDFECEAAYKDTLGDFSELLADPESAESLNDGMYAVYQAALELGDAAADTIGYVYSDMDEDGKEELLIGNFEGTGSPDVKNEIYAAFTHDGDTIEPLFEKQDRNTYALTDTGTFYFHGSDGEKYHIVAEYELTAEGMICKNFYFTYPVDGDGNNMAYYHNTTGVWNSEGSEKIDMTFEEFEAIRKDLAARTVPVDAAKLSDVGK